MATLKVTTPANSQNIEGLVTIKAPLAKVFPAYTDADLFSRWWGRGHAMKVYEFEARNGGAWHVAEQTEDGSEYEFRGTFHEVADNERIIQTFEFLGMPERGHVALERADFVAVDAHTTEIRTLSTFQSRDDRDGMMASGAEAGWRQSVEALGRLVEGSR
jgi:uncharacterized protein YndB with AHSA1/START domain